MGIGDSKIEFRRRALTLPNCKREEFHEFLQLATSADDFFSLITAKDIRETLVNSASIEQLIAFSCEIVEVELLEPTERKPLLLNAIRFLTRLLPFYFETVTAVQEGRTNANPPLLDLRPFAPMVYHLLFLPGFTISSPVPCIWERGIGVSKDAAFNEYPTSQMDSNKIEVLKLLMVLLSKQMYRPNESELLVAAVCDLDRQLVLITLCSLLNTICNFQFSSVLPYNHLVFGGAAGVKQELVRMCFHVLTALLNCHLERTPRGSVSAGGQPPLEIGNGVSSGHASIPSSPIRSLDGDDGQLLSPGTVSNNGTDQPQQQQLKPIFGNMFRHYVSKLHRKQDFDVIIDGLIRIMNNAIDADQVYLPNSVQHLNMTEESLMLLWIFITINNRFFAHICDSERVLDVVYCLTYQILSAKSSLANIGIVRLCAFLLHILSGERSFCVLLNRPFDRALPAHSEIVSFRGNYGDLIVLTVHCLVTTSKGAMSSLYDCLFTIVANISPYLKSFCSVTANKIIGLFRKFSTASFMLANESNHVLVFYLLDFMNNAVQYQFDGNNHLVYELVRNKELIMRLAGTSFEMLIQEKAEHAEKRRQKQAAGQSEAASGEGEEDINAASGVKVRRESAVGIGGDGKSSPDFTPTKEWFAKWHGLLPLQTLESMLETLVPQLERLCRENEWTDDAVLSYLQSGTLVGLLPVPHPIFVRKFELADGIRSWFTSYMWGVVYLRHLPPSPPIWLGETVSVTAEPLTMDSLFKQLLRYHSPFVAYHPLICRRWLSKSAGTSGKSLPTIKMSDLEKCFGCGAQFQDQNAERPGFLPDMQRRKEASLLGLPFEQYLRSVSNEVAVNPLANHNERKQQQLICARCHHLTFHRSLPAVEKSPNGDIRSDANETAERVLTALKQSPEGQVVAVCDILDFPGSLCLNILRQLPPQQPLTIAVNKADLLPEQSNFDRIHHYLKRLLKRELNGCVDLHLISAKSGQGVDKMVEQLFRRRYQLNRGGENIYLIGNTNVGKSSLLNRWLSAYQGRWGWRATESTVPGTTLDLISHQLNQLPGLRNAVVAGKSRIQVPASLDAVDSTFLPAKTSLFEPQRHSALTSSVISRLLGGRLVDTPGLENGENLADWLLAESHEELSLVQPTKPLRPESFLLRPGRSLWLGGMARLDYMESSNTIGADNDSSVQVIATVYRSPKVPLHLSSVEKATDLLQTQLGGQGKYWPESIIIPVKPTDKRAVRRKNPSKDLWSGVIMVPPVFSHPRQLLGRLSDHQIDINSERRDKVKQLSLLTERISRFPPFQLAKEFSIPCGDGVKVDSDIDGDYVKQMRQLSPHSPRHFSRSLVDVVIAGVGWLSLTGNFFSKDDGDRQARFQLYTPGGRGVSIRSPSMLPFDVMRRGHRVRTTDRYKQPSDSTINSAASADRQWWITNRSHVDR